MNTQMRWRTTWLKRGEWNVFLFSALCALMVASPCAGVSFAASSLALSSLSSLSAPGTPAPYDTVLWWLQQSADGAARGVTSRFSTTTPSNVLNAATLTPALHSVEIELPRLGSSQKGRHLIGQPAKAGFAPLLPATLVAGAPVAPRYDGTRRYATHSLTAHEASFRAGTRTNSFPE